MPPTSQKVGLATESGRPRLSGLSLAQCPGYPSIWGDILEGVGGMDWARGASRRGRVSYIQNMDGFRMSERWEVGRICVVY